MTCHHVYNYGATLQAYALQHYLERLGHEVEIIDYRLPSHRRYEWSYLPVEGRAYVVARKFSFLKWLIYLYRNRNYLKTWGRKKAFDSFDAEYLKMTEVVYRSTEDLRNSPPKADVYIAGSDQIWNTGMSNGHMPGYYLDFGDEHIKRISYAASFGLSDIRDDVKDFVKKEVSKLNAISVREISGVRILEAMGVADVDVVCDPVFLLTKEEWLRIARQSKAYNLDNDSYILLYDFIGDLRMEDFCKRLSQDTGKKIVSVNDSDIRSYADININDAGPLEFVSLIDKAAYVIANSFHATAFSVILEKDFYTFDLTSNLNASRIVDFLSLCGLSERFQTFQFQPQIDYSVVKERLNKYIKYSEDFLVQNLQ